MTAVELDDEKLRNGLISALIAYSIWGFLPVYFKFVHAVPALEMLAHRIVWAVPFGAAIVLFRRQFRHLDQWDPQPDTLTPAGPDPPLPHGETLPLTYHPVPDIA